MFYKNTFLDIGGIKSSIPLMKAFDMGMYLKKEKI